ncbi:MAG: pilus assembly protein [Sphingomonadales bacterium]|nr:pilus assembly protein [Sphingomonadales bacterium]
MRAFGAKLLADQSGTSTLEFAFVGPAFFAVIIGTFQTALVFLAQQGLETVAQDSARKLMTGQAQQAAMTASQFKTAACASLPPYMECSKLMVDVSVASSFSNANMNVPTITYNGSGGVTNTFGFNTGSQGSIVVVRVMYLWPVVGGVLNFNLSNQPNGNRLLVATSVLKSEFY